MTVTVTVTVNSEGGERDKRRGNKDNDTVQ